MQNWLIDFLGGILNGLALIALAIWTAISSPHEQVTIKAAKPKTKQEPVRKRHPRIQVALFWILGSLISASLIFQFWSAFRHYNYDTDLARYYEDNKFENSRMIQHRSQAAAALLEYLSNTNKNWDSLTNGTDDLDYVLGFFDELGYDEQHGRISADVIHEYFYADVVGYYQASEKYIIYSHKTDSPDDFKFVKPLFDSVTEVESRKIGQPSSALVWSNKDLFNYLKSEMKQSK